jgi:hypothetical protein
VMVGSVLGRASKERAYGYSSAASESSSSAAADRRHFRCDNSRALVTFANIHFTFATSFSAGD